MPVVEIDAKSLKVRYSWLIDAFRLDFNLILWTDDLKNAAIDDLERLYADFDEEKGEPKHLTMNQIQVTGVNVTFNNSMITIAPCTQNECTCRMVIL